MTLTIDTELYEEYKEQVKELSNQVTRVEDGEYVAELRTSEEIAEEIGELTPDQVADIRTIAEVEDTPMEAYHTADEKLE